MIFIRNPGDLTTKSEIEAFLGRILDRISGKLAVLLCKGQQLKTHYRRSTNYVINV